MPSSNRRREALGSPALKGSYNGSYRRPSSSSPRSVPSTVYPPSSRFSASGEARSNRPSCPSRLTKTYSDSGSTASPVLPGSVQGVVVHARKETGLPELRSVCAAARSRSPLGAGSCAARSSRAGGVEPEPDEDRWVRRVLLVPQGHLVRGEAGDAAGAVRRALHPLVDQALVPELLQEPPPRLDVAVVEGGVGVIHVHPVGDALRQVLPRLDVAHDALAAAGVEAVDAVGLDLLLAGQAQLLLHLQLHGQAVGVPPTLADDAVAAHGLVAGDDVFEDPCEDVVDAGGAVGRGRALVEHEQGLLLVHLPAPFGLRPPKDVALSPEAQAPAPPSQGSSLGCRRGGRPGLRRVPWSALRSSCPP